MTSFITVFALMWWSEIERVLSPKYCKVFANIRWSVQKVIYPLQNTQRITSAAMTGKTQAKLSSSKYYFLVQTGACWCLKKSVEEYTLKIFFFLSNFKYGENQKYEIFSSLLSKGKIYCYLVLSASEKHGPHFLILNFFYFKAHYFPYEKKTFFWGINVF